MTYPNGVETRYFYDSLNRLTGLETRDIHDGVVYSASYTLGPSGNRVRLEENGGRTVNYTYDSLYRLTKEEIQDSVHGNKTISYTYDAVGNRLTREEGGDKTLYTYDANDRLVQEERQVVTGQALPSPEGRDLKKEAEESSRVFRGAVGVFSGIYLAGLLSLLFFRPLLSLRPDNSQGRKRLSLSIGLLITPFFVLGTEAVPAFALSSHYVEVLNQTMSITIDYLYDANGNLISRTDSNGTTTFGYNSENRLVSVNAPGKTMEYAYDFDGIRIASTVDGATTHYLIDKIRDFPQVIEERGADGTLLASYVYGDDLISQKRGGVKSYYHHDGQMSVRALTSAAGAVTDRYTYDAFGIPLATEGTTVNHYLYGGEQYDPNIGFYYLRARYMDPQIGRFISMDSFDGGIYDPKSLHKYVYAYNDPVRYFDPSGNSLLAMVAVVAIIALLVAALYPAIHAVVTYLLFWLLWPITGIFNFAYQNLILSRKDRDQVIRSGHYIAEYFYTWFDMNSDKMAFAWTFWKGKGYSWGTKWSCGAHAIAVRHCMENGPRKIDPFRIQVLEALLFTHEYSVANLVLSTETWYDINLDSWMYGSFAPYYPVLWILYRDATHIYTGDEPDNVCPTRVR